METSVAASGESREPITAETAEPRASCTGKLTVIGIYPRLRRSVKRDLPGSSDSVGRASISSSKASKVLVFMADTSIT